MRNSRRFAAPLLLPIASAMCFGFSGPFAKSLMAAGWSPGAASILRCVGAASVLLVIGLLTGASRKWPGRSAVAYGFFAVALAQTTFFLSLTRLPVGVTLMIQFCAPVVVILWEWLVRQVPQSSTTLAGAALAIAGAVLVINPFGGSGIDPIGVAWAVASMIGQVGFFLLSTDNSDADPIGFTVVGLLVGAAIVGTLSALGVVDFAVSAGPVTLGSHELPWWAAFLPLAVVATAFAYLTGVAAVAALGSTLSSVILLSEVLFAVVFAWLLLGETITSVQCIGGAVLVIGVAIAKLRTRETRLKTAEVAAAAV
ncbi:MAG: DMT family transporter [Nocardiaceae bacterium]|nr:DMT family transporter [Nocardiaceae bacterium]